MAKAVKLVFGTFLVAGACGAQAAVVDLTVAGNSGTINGATYTQAQVSPGGTGVLGSFVRMQSQGNSTDEQAFNTTVMGSFDNIGGSPNNHEITVGGTGFIDLNGAAEGGEVMRFILDVNEPRGTGQNDTAPLITLSEVQIFLSRTPNQGAPASPADQALLSLADVYLVYQMDAGAGDNSVTLNAALSAGSGETDMYLDIPLIMFNSAFTAGGFNSILDKNNAYIYLYSRFAGAEGTFEEWAAADGLPLVEQPCNPEIEDCDGQEVPEPGALSLFAIGLGGAAVMARRRRKL